MHTSRKYIGEFLFFLMLVGISLSGCNTFVSDPDEWTTISHNEYDFSIDYPANWNAETYDVHGKRGDEEIKLDIYPFLGADLWIKIRRNASVSEPDLEDVLAWSNVQINNSQRNSIKHKDDPDYYFEEIFLVEDEINGHPIMRHRYQSGIVLKEEVYIARANDMIIITLQNPKTKFDSNLDDFNRMVNSFTPLE